MDLERAARGGARLLLATPIAAALYLVAIGVAIGVVAWEWVTGPESRR